MTTGLGLLRVKFLDPWPEMFSIAQDRRFLTSMVMLPLPDWGGGLAGAGYHSSGDLTNRWYLPVWFLCWGWQDANFQVDRLVSGKTCAVGQWLQ